MRGLKRITAGCLLVLVLVFNGFIGAFYVPAPSNLEIAVYGSDSLSVILNWMFVDPDSANGFIIYKNSTPVDSIPTDTTQYIDNSQVLGYFYVTAYKETEESNPSNTVSDTVIVTPNLQIWDFCDPSPDHPSAFGWDTFTGFGFVYNCWEQYAEYIDSYLYTVPPFAIMSADEPPFLHGIHSTGILNMYTYNFNIAPPLSYGYLNFEEAVEGNYYAVVTRLETSTRHFAKVYMVYVEISSYIIFDAYYQLVPGLRLLGSATAVEEKKPIVRFPQKYLTVSPNPFITSAIISLPSIEHSAEGIELIIYDVSGRLVKSFPLTTNHFSLGTNLKSGVYFLKAGGFKPVKVVKLR